MEKKKTTTTTSITTTINVVVRRTNFAQSGQALLIRRSDTAWPTNGTFFIAVYAYSASNYSITVAAGSIQLQDGIAVQGHAETRAVS